MLKKVMDWCLKLSCGAAGAFVLFIVGMSSGSISLFNIYEPEMPQKLIPKDGE